MSATVPGPTVDPPPALPALAVRAVAVSYRYGDRVALDALSLDVPQGAIFGLLGPNGSGKSTLLSLLIGRRDAASGTLEVLGERVSPRLRARLGMLFQEPALDPLMTVRETMMLQARLFGMRGGVASARIEELLSRVGLDDRASAYTNTLSGGMRRRLEAARALLPSPELILLDEPTLALDPDSRIALWQYLIDANAGGCTLLVATNDVHEAERYCDTVALLDEGRVVTTGTPAALKRGLRRDAVRIDWRNGRRGEDEVLRQWEGVGSVREAGGTTHVTVDAASPFLARAFQQWGDEIRAVRVEESTLEDVYFQLVGRGIVAPAEADR